MPTAATLGARAHAALEKATEVVAEHGSAERLEGLQNITTDRANTRSPHHLAAFQAELFASLAEIVQDQAHRIAELEKANTAKSAAPKKK
ncbi:MAG: hypothetical protein M3426_16910 [Actinomycetota bacterium]|nr:hypothetical protein [Actinomycetota bacterium]